MKHYRNALFITVAAMCIFIALTVISASAQIIYGDTDSDSTISVMDATAIQRHISKAVELTGDCLKAADVDADDMVSVLDATEIQRYIAKVIDKFPADEVEDVTTNKETINKISEKTTIHFSNNRNWKTVYAYIYNNETGAPMTA